MARYLKLWGRGTSRQGTGIIGLIEKPDASEAPSKLASIGRYVLTPDIFETLRGLSAGKSGEIQLADAINEHARQGSVETVRLSGRRFDCGSVTVLWLQQRINLLPEAYLKMIAHNQILYLLS